MLGLNPLASAALGDLGSRIVALTGSSVTTGSPTVGTSVLTQVGSLTGQNVDTQSPSVGTSALSQNHAISATYNGNGASVPNATMFEDESFSAPNVITGTVRIGTGVLSGNHALSSPDVTLGNPVLTSIGLTENNDLGLSDITYGSPTVSSTAISQVHNVSSSDIDFGSVVVDTSNISQIHNFATNNVETGNINLPDAVFRQIHDLGSTDVSTQSTSVDSTDLDEINVLSASDINFGSPTVSTTNITQVHTLDNHDAISTGAVSIASTAITQVHNITSDNAETDNVDVATSAITQVHDLTSDSVTSGAISISQGVFTQNHPFSSADISLGNVDIDTTTCIFSFDFAASDINYGTPTVAQTSISQIHNIEAVYNGRPADVPSLTVFEDETFSAPDVFTGTVRIAPAIFIQDHLFASADIAAQQPSVDNAILTGNHLLTSDDVIANAPTVDDTIYGVEFLSDDVSTQAPVIDQTGITQIHNMQPTISLGGVDVQTTAITQLHFLAGDDVITNNVEVQSTKNPWDEKTDIDAESYTETLPPSEIWSDANPANLIFSEIDISVNLGLNLISSTEPPEESWRTITEDITKFKNKTGRIVFYHKSDPNSGGDFFKADLQLDNINVDGTIANWSTNPQYQTSTGSTSYEDATFAGIPDGAINGRWSRLNTTNTPSSGTGYNRFSNGFVYTEATSTTAGWEFWMRTPIITLSSEPVLSYVLASGGSAIGTFKVYFELTEPLFSDITLGSSTWTEAA